jgi:hypothetical protein
MHQLFGFGYLGGAEFIPMSEVVGRKEVAKRHRVSMMLKS